MSPKTWTGRVFIATSLDGYIARPDSDVNWLTNPPKDPSHLAPSSPRTVKDFTQFMSRVDCMVMGRKSYEKGLSQPQWPYGSKRTFVLSTTLSAPLRSDPVVEIVSSLEEAGEVFEREEIKSVYVDGGQVVQAFLRNGWIDEIVLTTAPVLLGKGISLFEDLESDVRLRLVAVDVIEDGMVSVAYHVVKEE